MRLYAFLILASYAFHARAASLPALDVKDVEKKLASVAEEVAKKDVVPSENTSSEQELVDQGNAVNEVENNLRVIPKITDIPVKVVVEDVQPSLKIDSEKKDEPIEIDETPDVKRAEIDLNNPGAPQRQQHETQNPEHYDEPIAVNVKKVVDDTKTALKQGLGGIGQGIGNWIGNNQQTNVIQQGLQDLYGTIQTQFSKLNETLQNLVPGNVKPAVSTAQKDSIENVQHSLRTLENNFENAVKSISNDVQTYATQKAEGETETASGGSEANNNFILQAFQTLQNTLLQGFNNVTSSIQSTFNIPANNANNTGPAGFITGIQNIFTGGGQQTQPAGAQSDEASTSRPGWPIWHGIQNSINSILNPGQNQAAGQNSQPAPPGPIAQAIQNNPLVQGVVNLIQPKPGAQQPATEQAVKPAESNQQEGSNDVPTQPAAANTEEKKPEVTDGPIKKIIQNNPIVKGISGAVQKLQSFSNPEKPRDTFEGEKDDKDEKNNSDVKGLIGGFHGIHGGHGGHGGNKPNKPEHGPNIDNNIDTTITAGHRAIEKVECEKVESPEKTMQPEETKTIDEEKTEPKLPEVTVKTE